MGKKLRFATAILNFSKKKGGAEKYLVELCTRLASEGDEIHIYTENWDEENPEIHFHRVKSFPFPKSLRLISFAVIATNGIKKGSYDIAFGVGNTLGADILQPHGGVHWAWFWRSLRAYTNLFIWMIKFLGRIFSLKQWVSGWIEDAPYKKAKTPKIIAISDMVKKDIMLWYGIPEERITVVYNGVDIGRFHPHNRQYRDDIRKRHGIRNEIVLLFVSNNFRMKGLVFLIKALAILNKENHPLIKLIILGRDRKAPYLRLAKKHGILEKIVFAGSTDEPEKYYGAADLLVHPSFYDACSLTVLEALASGLPVITSSSNGASGVITSGEEGFVITDPRDEKKLAQHISFYLNDEVRHRASIAARCLAENYSLERNFMEVRKFFQQDISHEEPKE